jgi:transmembrane sensor
MNIDRLWTLLSRKLAGEATGAELIELDNIITQFPNMALPLQLNNEFWEAPVEADNDFLEATFHLHSQRLNEKGYNFEEREETGSLSIEKTTKAKKRKFFLIGISMAVILGSLFAFYGITAKSGIVSPKTAPPHSEVSTRNGSRTKIQLPDGSAVWLNSDSKLTYDNEHFGGSIREVSLIGEAYFDVVKNPAKPFIIHTAKMDIKVLGTAFNVKCYPGEKNTETSLIRGSIEVTLKDRQEKIFLKPNEKLIISNDEVKPAEKAAKAVQKLSNIKQEPIIELNHLTLYPKDNSIVETAWVENRLVFNDEALEDIAVKMERWYGVTIEINNEKLKKVQIAGSFEKETVYEALNALQLTTPFTYKIEKDIIVISK